MIGIVGLLVVIVLVVFMLFKDNSVLISAESFENILKSQSLKNARIDDYYIYFDANQKSFKVLRAGIDLSELKNIPIRMKTHMDFSEIFSDIGMMILALIGIAVILRALNLMSKKTSQNNTSKPLMETHLFQENTQKNDAFILPVPINSSVKFQDVAGIKEVKEELVEMIDYLKNPKKYQDLGISLPKGVLLIGPPGVGKTMIAKAVAGEAGVPFFYQSGSSFVQIYVGMGAKRVRELFAKAKAKAPSIVFIDEIDAVGKARGGNRNDEREATLNQLLTEMDGFEDSGGVIVIGATNKMEIIDEALLRSGRFDRRIYVELPDLDERIQILEVYLRHKKYDFNLLEVSKMCVGFSGASIASLINESALNALKRGSDIIQLRDIIDVKDKVILGKKKILSFDEQEKNILSVYQSAKAISAYWFDIDFDKVTLISDFLLDRDKEVVGKSEMTNKIKVYLSGIIALELIFDEKYTYAKEDIKKAIKIAKDMCEEYGMAKRLITNDADVSEILNLAYNEQKDFLNNSKEIILTLSKKLLEKEKLNKNTIREMMQDVL
ncbi:AAA family ATPase [Helicobacter sp. 11S03491-1]|uniref:AAA family ATPase n=1 Tax=Helicobacter sp. 11S03491-1 TaxID=1476196 RepID=UPI000BA76267|nr:AAA family ATPase [Helicobacter sp. 11S03491-1]